MTILLHACCGPCAIYPLDTLVQAGHDVTLFYMNPNIQPRSEWQRRLESTQIVADKMGVPLLLDNLYLEDEYVKRQDDKDRCLFCYDIRLKMTKKRAFEDRFHAFSTTLLVSPYQNREAIVSCGRSLATPRLLFLDTDWRSGFRQGQDAGREMNLYRQKYCGCLPSIELSRYKDKIKARHLVEAGLDQAEPPASGSIRHK